jgi:2-deoxy-D-gluconate 3-dehydrogenase
MKWNVKGKTVLITGAAGGLGREIAYGFCGEECNVVLADFNEQAGRELEAELKKISPTVLFVPADVTNSKSVEAMCAAAADAYGSLDILINSAGITDRRAALDFPEESFDRIIAVNLKGTFLCCQAAGRIMVKQGGGKIVNLSSIGGTIGLRNTVAYCASKGGVVQLTRALAVDWAQYNINVNAVAPSLNNTPIAKQVFADKKTYEWFLSKIPLGRLCEPRDVSSAVLFLSSEASDYITGHILAVDGGWTVE